MLKMTLLYAEDDRETRENYIFVLKKYFYEVYAAKDGEEALQIYREKQPDILLLDISMPKRDGLEVAQIVRERDKTTPIVMLTAHSEQERLMKAIPLGLSAYLLKPVDDMQLLKEVNRLIAEIEKNRYVKIDDDLKWHPENAFLYYGEDQINLTKKEMLLVHSLMDAGGQYVDKDRLIMQIWEDDVCDYSHENKLTQLVYRLNKKITSLTGKESPFIENAYALGYRIS